MVDVKRGVASQPLVDEVDELLERRLLARAVVRPERLVAGLALLEPVDAEEVLEPLSGAQNGSPSMSKKRSPGDG